jgi:hypothetical protein
MRLTPDDTALLIRAVSFFADGVEARVKNDKLCAIFMMMNVDCVDQIPQQSNNGNGFHFLATRIRRFLARIFSSSFRVSSLQENYPLACTITLKPEN